MKVTRRSALALAAMTGMAWTVGPAFAADKLRVGKSIGSSFPFSGADLAKAKGIFAAHGICGFENVANLEQLPARGAFIVALPMKIAGGTGGPLRIVAVL